MTILVDSSGAPLSAANVGTLVGSDGAPLPRLERVCKACGCTEQDACAGGCAWADPQIDICISPLVVIAVVLVVVERGAFVASCHPKGLGDARRAAFDLVEQLAKAGERNAGVAALEVIWRIDGPLTSPRDAVLGAPPPRMWRDPYASATCDRDAWTTEDVALVQAFAAFVEWTLDERDCAGHPAGPYDPMGETVYCDGSCWTRGRRSTGTSNMQRFGELVARGLDATDAGHIATGRVQ